MAEELLRDQEKKIKNLQKDLESLAVANYSIKSNGIINSSSDKRVRVKSTLARDTLFNQYNQQSSNIPMLEEVESGDEE
ncbi:MAG: hypothetical protein MHPSP_000999 [Paramarteilia canceri]